VLRAAISYQKQSMAIRAAHARAPLSHSTFPCCTAPSVCFVGAAAPASAIDLLGGLDDLEPAAASQPSSTTQHPTLPPPPPFNKSDLLSGLDELEGPSSALPCHPPTAATGDLDDWGLLVGGSSSNGAAPAAPQASPDPFAGITQNHPGPPPAASLPSYPMQDDADFAPFMGAAQPASQHAGTFDAGGKQGMGCIASRGRPQGLAPPPPPRDPFADLLF